MLETYGFVDDSVQAGFCNEFVFEEAVPVRYGKLAGNDEGLFVAVVIKDLLEVILELSLNWFHSKVFEDDDIVTEHLATSTGWVCYGKYRGLGLKILGLNGEIT